jgi:hypothetical protein
MMKKTVLLSIVCVVGLTACASPQPAPVPVPVQVKPVQNSHEMAVVGSDGRADVRMTVDKLVDYCQDWAKAYERRLGKDYIKAYDECVDLTAQMMRDQADKLMEESKAADAFPFVSQ